VAEQASLPVSGTTVAALVASLETELVSLGPAARAMSRELVAALLDMPRSWPVLHPEERLGGMVVTDAHAAARRLAAGAPLAYAVRRAAFRNLVLHVDERVLIPRHETALLIDVVLELVGSRRGGIVADVGTGSGAIALSLACEGPFERVFASDVSRGALAVAELNAGRLRDHLCAPVELFHGSLLAPLPPGPLRCVVSNPPYIALGEAAELPASVRDWEPPVALYGGTSGMDAIAGIVREAGDRLEPGGTIVMEVDCRRASTAAELLATDGRYSDILVRLDLTGRERFVAARRR
jgi:release factor glutamine methyltransferase